MEEASLYCDFFKILYSTTPVLCTGGIHTFMTFFKIIFSYAMAIHKVSEGVSLRLDFNNKTLVAIIDFA